MSVATSSAVASSSTSAAAEPQPITDPKDVADDTPAEKTFFFLSPQVASYFVGTFCTLKLKFWNLISGVQLVDAQGLPHERWLVP